MNRWPVDDAAFSPVPRHARGAGDGPPSEGSSGRLVVLITSPSLIAVRFLAAPWVIEDLGAGRLITKQKERERPTLRNT